MGAPFKKAVQKVKFSIIKYLQRSKIHPFKE